ncbi:DUF2938 domain-containing protein [Pseudoalteromonas sp. KS88]|uniref:DUF2938 domain-containing protein n=1 Tax=Pseudoalteromonas sp. KS88 TaxID=2109918 RepID=UPI001081FA75|nr:DUF2938 domain-containing protein [Pseudoalteromonas sp. KS88]TGE84811.1 DUF2938 domain-containing protein [Pseudoalteromonas sp. KS88]
MFESIDWTTAIVIGVGATVLLDVWSLILAKVFAVSSLNFCLVGRWVSLMRYGLFKHASISQAQAQNKECSIGWCVHYFIGVIFALVFLLLVPSDWLSSPKLFHALFFGLLTVCFPFFIMQPALGLGIAASNAKRPFLARVKSCLSHCVFGVGLYVSALLLTLM